MSGRIACITPNCRRTAPAEKYEEGTEIICGKCFRNLPQHLRADHRRFWKEIRKWRRRVTKTADELKLQRMHGIEEMWCKRLNENWEAIRSAVANPEKPEGLEAILEELGL